MERLTRSKIKTLKPGKHGDGKNLWLVVSSTGRMTWAFFYTLNGKRREKWLKSYEEMTPDEAREEAFRLRRMIREGRDPLAESSKAPARRLTTFEAVAEKAIESLQAGFTNKKAKDQWLSSLKAYAFDRLGQMDVRAITTEDIYEVLKPIWMDKKETASRLRQRMERILAFATAMKMRSGDNPAAWKNNLDLLLPPQKKKVKHHTAMAYANVPAFLAELRSNREGIDALALEFTLLTVLRTNEVTQARWAEIDLDKATWTIPRARMKEKDEDRGPHEVPLSPPALALLKRVDRRAGSDFVFYNPDTRKPLSNGGMDALLDRMGRKDDATVHGFRSSFKDWTLERTAYPDAVSEAALDHKEANKVRAAYARTKFIEMRTQLMDDWGAFVGGQEADADNVVPIRGGV